MHGVEAPGLRPPHLRRYQASSVAAPGGARPPRALAEEFRIRAECRFDAGVCGVLGFDSPTALEHPARDEVVVVGVQGAHSAEEDAFVREGGEEGFVVEDVGAVGGGAAG